MKLLIFTLALSVAVLANNDPPGWSDKPCPSRPYVSSFDVNAFQGLWYIVKGNGLGSCVRNDIVPTGPYEYTSTLCQKYEGENSCSEADVDHPYEDGRLTFVADGYGGTGNISYIEYDNYYIGYQCQNSDDGQSQTSVVIVSRTPTLSDEVLKEADKKMKKYFEENDLEDINQDEEFCAV